MLDEEMLPFIVNLSPIIMWIALTLGLLLFVIGYFAGGRLAARRIVICIIIATVIGALSLPVPIKIFSLVEQKLNIKMRKTVSTGIDTQTRSAATDTISIPKDGEISEFQNDTSVVSGVSLSLQLSAFFLYLLWSAFLVGMGIFLYETLTVTAIEAENAKREK